MPAERGRSRLAQELKTQASAQQERIVTLKERINAPTGELEEALKNIRSPPPVLR
jgi:hypothetical protein